MIHETVECGFWVEFPTILGCESQRYTFEKLLENLYQTIEGCLLKNLLML